MLINLLENGPCCRFSVVWHLSKFRGNIFASVILTYVDALLLVPLVKTGYIFKSILLCFFFYMFHFKMLFIFNKKNKIHKIQKGFQISSLVAPSKVFHIPFYLQLHLGNPSGGNRPNRPKPNRQTLQEGI